MKRLALLPTSVMTPLLAWKRKAASVQLPPALQVEPGAVHWAFEVQAPFWKTPIGPTGAAQVLVTYA